MLKKSTTNTFDQGLLMDMNPIVTPNNVVTNCLNGTLITYNGNEYVLLNDMGNGRVETAYLPEGYIPMGTAELGGIIYILSYNPLKGMCLIGSFPSPERNLTSDEFLEQTASLSISNFYKKNEKDEEDKTSYTYKDSITSTLQRLILSDKFIYPGDKFQISSVDLKPDIEYISAFAKGSNKNLYLNPKYLKLSVISISEEGKYENLNDNLIWYPLQDKNSESDTEYYIRNMELGESDKGKVDLSEYRSLTLSNYNIFQGSEKGKLGILAELECIDTFTTSYTISLKASEDSTMTIYSPKLYLNWTYDNPLNPNKINLYGVHVRITYAGNLSVIMNEDIILDYPYLTSDGTVLLGSTDILEHEDSDVFLIPDYSAMTDLLMEMEEKKDELELLIKNTGEISVEVTKWIADNKTWLSIHMIDSTKTPVVIFNLLKGIINSNLTALYNRLPRQNDGTDTAFIVNLPKIEISNTSLEQNSILYIEVTPLMPFGAIEYLTLKYTLDLQKIGTGTFDFVRYQYQNYENENIMNIGINTYPEEGASFQDLSVEFYSLTLDMYDRLVKTDTNSHLYNGGAVFDNCNTIIQRGKELWANKQTVLNPEIVCDVISGEDKFHVIELYIGILPNAITISLNPDDFADSLIEICKISFKYAKGEKVNIYSYYRIYFSNDVFNNVDSSECADFSILKFPIRYNITYNPKVDQLSSKSKDYPVSNRFDLSPHSTNTKYSLECSYNIDINSSLNFINDLIIYTGSYTSAIELNDIIIDQYTLKTVGNIEANIEDIPTIGKEDNTYKIASSFYAVYNTRTDDYTLGTLVPLEIGTAYLKFLPDKLNLRIGFSTEYSYEGGTTGTLVVIPDKERGKGVIIDSEQGNYTGWSYTLSTLLLKTLLEDKDLLIIQGCLFGAFNNNYDGTKIRIYLTGESIDTIENVLKGHDFTFIFLLAFLDTSGLVRIFSLNPQGYTTCLYFDNSYMSIGNRSFSSPFDYGRDPDDSDNTTQWSSEWPLNDKIENFKRLFKPYYKIDTSDQRLFTIYTSSVAYYDDYILNGTVTNTGNITDLKVTYNKIKIESDERINNLNYPDSIPISTELVINIPLPEIDYPFFTDPNRQIHYIYDLEDILTSITYDLDYLFYTGNLNEDVYPPYPYLLNNPQNSIYFPTKKDKDLADTSLIPPIPYEWININDWVESAIHGKISNRYYRIYDLSETFPQTFIFILAELSNSDGLNMTLYGLNTINVFSE